MLGRKFARLKGSWENLLQSALDYDEPAVFREISELVEVTERATNEALFGSEDLLQSLQDRDLCDWIGDDEADSAPEAEDSSATEDEEADGAPESDGVANAEGSRATENEAADGAPGSDGVASAPGAEDGEEQGAPGPETSHQTKEYYRKMFILAICLTLTLSPITLI